MYKKLVASLIGSLAVIGFIASAHAAVSVGWSATSTNYGYITPTAINGLIDAIKVPFIVATSSTATNNFAGSIIINGENTFGNSTPHLSITAGAGAVPGTSCDALNVGNASQGTVEFGIGCVNDEIGVISGNDDFLAVKDSWPNGGFTYGDGVLHVTCVGCGSGGNTGNVGIGTSSPYASLSVAGRGVFDQDIRTNYVTATSTTKASTFPYASTTVTSASTLCLSTDCRTAWPTGAAYPFTPTTNYAVTNQATTGIPWFKNGLNASSTSHFVYASTTALSSTGNVTVGGSLGVGTTNPSSPFQVGTLVTYSQSTAPTLLSGTQNTPAGGCWFADGNVINARLYAYVNGAGGVQAFSPTYTTATFTDDSSFNSYSVNWSWTAAAGASGYYMTIRDLDNGYNFDYGIDMGNTTTYTDDGCAYNPNPAFPTTVASGQGFKADLSGNAGTSNNFYAGGTLTTVGNAGIATGPSTANALQVGGNIGFSQTGEYIDPSIGTDRLSFSNSSGGAGSYNGFQVINTGDSSASTGGQFFAIGSNYAADYAGFNHYGVNNGGTDAYGNLQKGEMGFFTYKGPLLFQSALQAANPVIMFGGDPGAGAPSLPLLTLMSNGSGHALDGFASSTPWGVLSVGGDSKLGNRPLFAIGSSTATQLVVTAGGKVGIATTSPDSTLDVNGTFRLEGTSAFTTASISGAITGIGCDTSDTTGLTGIASTTVFVTTPKVFPGNGVSFYTMALTSTSARTYVCSDVTLTPNASTYNVRIIR